MPSNERGGLHDREDSTPIDEPRQGNQRDPRGIVGTTGLHLPFDVQRQLLAKEQILGGEVGMRPDGRGNEACDVSADPQDCAGCGPRARPGHHRGNLTR
jgi:hypothetical protein